MHKDKDDILAKGFRKKLKDYELPVDTGIWEKIDRDLSAKKRIRPVWQYIASAAASVALILSIAWGWNKYHPMSSGSSEELLTVKTTDPIISKENIPNPLAEEPLQKHTRPIIQTDLSKNSSISHAAKEKTIPVPEEEKEAEPIDLVAENVPAISEEKEDASGKDKKEKSIEELFPDFKEDELWAYEEIKTRKKGNGISFGLAYGNQNASSNPQDENASLTEYADNFPNSLRLSTTSLAEEIVFSETSYKTPVTIGLSVRKNLDGKWALESGLSYTYLETNEINSLTNGISNTGDIRMHYVGIPVKFVYSFYDRNRLSLYASAGGMVEKSVYAQEQNTEGTKNKLTIKEPQWSVSGNVGLNYKLINHLGLFVEPGIAYYFDDKSDIPTIRKDKPFNFNIQVGLRLMY